MAVAAGGVSMTVGISVRGVPVTVGRAEEEAEAKEEEEPGSSEDTAEETAEGSAERPEEGPTEKPEERVEEVPEERLAARLEERTDEEPDKRLAEIVLEETPVAVGDPVVVAELPAVDDAGGKVDELPLRRAAELAALTKLDEPGGN